jgi:hypothetical protein
LKTNGTLITLITQIYLLLYGNTEPQNANHLCPSVSICGLNLCLSVDLICVYLNNEQRAPKKNKEH